jgi:hypothetical protein
MKRFRVPIFLATLGLTLLAGLGTASAQETTAFNLLPVNSGCLPNAKGRVVVFHKEEALGVDTLRLRVSELPPNTDFAVFLTSADAFASPPFGVTEYIGDFTTNAAGLGSLQVDAIVEEAFVSNPGTPRTSTQLDHLVFWFADPNQVPGCFHFTGATPFDGDGNAGPAAMSSSGDTGLE